MKFLILPLFITITAHAQLSNEAHQKAVQTFKNKHFFKNGEGMMLSPGLIRYVELATKGTFGTIGREILKKRYGFNIVDGEAIGLHRVKYEKMNIGVLGCAACHSGKAAGRYIVGLGNKAIDVYTIGKDARRIQKAWGATVLSPKAKRVHKKAMHFAKVISDEEIRNLTPGLVPISTITTFFYDDLNLPYPKDLGRGQVKIPHLWGFEEKRKAGVFNDGIGSSHNIGWEFGAELFASGSSEHMKEVLPEVKKLVENSLNKLLPPKYPFAIYEGLAQEGKKLFNQTCYKCHGKYENDVNGFPIYKKPKKIELAKIKTDPDRLNSVPKDFKEIVARSSAGDVLSVSDNYKPGYIAPRLEGIWARFPYLHNASVPTLYELLITPAKRSKTFSIKDIGEEYRFDQSKVGLNDQKSKKIYDTSKEGHSNQGHYFKFMDGYSDKDRKAIIEYLKTL